MISFHRTLSFVDNSIVIDLSGWEWAVFQFVGPSGTINVTATNNDGGSTSVTGGPGAATDFQAVQITKLADGTAVTAIAAAGLYRAAVVGRFIRFQGASAAATGVYMSLFKSQ
jgi:hypothetical protein